MLEHEARVVDVAAVRPSEVLDHAEDVLAAWMEEVVIDVTGRGEGMGRPLLYGTTPLFLEQFALRHLEELPRADELAVTMRVEPRAI